MTYMLDTNKGFKQSSECTLSAQGQDGFTFTSGFKKDCNDPFLMCALMYIQFNSIQCYITQIALTF